MEPIKIFDLIGGPLLILSLAILFWLEGRYTLRPLKQKRKLRVLNNIAFALPSLVSLRLIFIPLILLLALKNQHWRVGILHVITAAEWIEFIVAILLLDWLTYIWHWMTHKIQFLWQFHRVHHTDPDLDLSTGIRFHFLELLISLAFRGAAVVAVGATPLQVIVYEIVFEFATNFHHSNLRLPLRFEKVFNLAFVTPRMHGVHHSVKKDERDSNFSTIFSLWDRLHRTFRSSWESQPVIGYPPFIKFLSLKKLLILPFKKDEAE